MIQPFLGAIPTSAANEVGSFDNTAIEDDLKNVDLKNYPQNSLGEVDIISLMEYGYSEHSYIDKYFGIYVYVYNPTGKPITLSGNNYVELGFYENGGTRYDTVNLQYLDRTSDNLIYKFKLDQSARILASARSYAAVNEGKRCYEISDIQFTANSLHADVSKKYVWSGYAAYCGPDSSPDSTLTCLDYGLKSIHLNLMHTNYRFADKVDNGIDYVLCDELNSVFFTIPEEFFVDFGNLYKIKAQWYEYKTSPMFVTSNDQAYSALFSYRNILINEYGQPIDEYGNKLDPEGWSKPYWRVVWDQKEHPLVEGGYITFSNSYNPLCFYGTDPFHGPVLSEVLQPFFATYAECEKDDCAVEEIHHYHYESRLDWLFYIDSDIAGYDILGEDGLFTKADYRVTSDQVKEYMKTYTSMFYTQEKVLGKYASDLFADSIDQDRIQYLDDKSKTSGLITMEFIAGEDSKGNIGNSFTTPDYSQDFWDWLFNGRDYLETVYSPIVTVEEGDLYLSDEKFSEKYYVNVSDAKKFKSEAKRAYSSGEVPMFLRFAVTDYYASTARFDRAEEDQTTISKENGYVAQETVFLDFDVLSLGFMDEENGYVETLIPVVAEPIDIINGLTPPDSLVEDEEWYQKLVALILLIIVACKDHPLGSRRVLVAVYISRQAYNVAFQSSALQRHV